MNWIQKHALMILARCAETDLKSMRPQGVESNLFAYHIHFLKTQGYIESPKRGVYHLTPKGERLVGTFSTDSGLEAQNVKTVIMLYTRHHDDLLLFRWSRHPYFGILTLPHDRYNYDMSLEDSLAMALKDKLAIDAESGAQASYKKSGLVKIYHRGELVTHMSCLVYEVTSERQIPQAVARNGQSEWVSQTALSTTDVIGGMRELITAIESPEPVFDVSLEY